MPPQSPWQRRFRFTGNALVRFDAPLRVPERIFDGIPGFAAWLALILTVTFSILYPQTLLVIAALLGFYTALRFLIAGIANGIGIREMGRWERTDWVARYAQSADAQALPWDAVQHLVIIPNYKEPEAVLRRTLENLATQYQAKQRLYVVLAMEGAEADCAAKAERLIAEYADMFAQMYFTVHPKGLPDEMQCKSANERYAGRWAKHKLVDELGLPIAHICVTTQDADTRWHPRYFEALTYAYATNPQRHERFWQGLIRYDGNVWDINPLMRIVNAFSSMMELAHLANRSWQPLPFSSYSLSLRLLEACDYWDGAVIADELHMFIKAFYLHGGRIQTERILLPFIADASIGNTLWEALLERYRQTLRHAWGSKEVGYALQRHSETPNFPWWRSARLFMRVAHDIFLAGAGWIIVTLGSQLPVILHPELAPVSLPAILADPATGIQQAFYVISHNPAWTILSVSMASVLLMSLVFWHQDIVLRPKRTRPATLSERLWTLISIPALGLLSVLVLALPVLQAQTRLMLGMPLQFRVTRKA